MYDWILIIGIAIGSPPYQGTVGLYDTKPECMEHATTILNTMRKELEPDLVNRVALMCRYNKQKVEI